MAAVAICQEPRPRLEVRRTPHHRAAPLTLASIVGFKAAWTARLLTAIVQTVFADVVAGIISTPAGMTNLSPGVVAADDPVHAAEPATLILLASALTLTAHRLRRRR